MQNEYYTMRFENAVSASFKTIAGKMIFRPSQGMDIFRILRKQNIAKNIRKKFNYQGITIPPVAIFSITENCNLKCKGCYAACRNSIQGQSVSPDNFSAAISNLSNHGIRIIMIAGGEPFTCSWLNEAMKMFRDTLFIVFTNGLFIDSSKAREFKKSGNIIPVLSIEGGMEHTDERRGTGMFEKILSVSCMLRKEKVIFGFSHTVNSENLEEICSDKHIHSLMKFNPGIIFNVEYVPAAPDTEYLTLSETDRSKVIRFMNLCRKKYKSLFITMPGDEAQWGGCLAAGRGFFHINSAGNIEPCPFAPLSPGNIFDTPLIQLLQSGMFASIRKNHHLLTETSGGCALWSNRELIAELIKN
jgi:MoaA/NifB/PqqE/SkfB family radical SAM enzyme